MGDISASRISSKSPRQIISVSCLRTAGVGSTGKSAARFIGREGGLVASVASADRGVAPGSAVGSHRPSIPPRCVGRVSSVRLFLGSVAARVSVASASLQYSPVALFGGLLRRSGRVRGVASSSGELRSVASNSVALRRSSALPRSVLPHAFERLAARAVGGVSERLSRRFSTRQAEHPAGSCGVHGVPVLLRRQSPAGARRYH